MSDRPRVYRTEGLILRRRNLGEADSVFTVLTANGAKLDAVARGIRRARSRMRGHLEPLTRSQLLLARGRTLDVFTQAQTLHAYRGLREDLERSALAIYCAELADRFAVEQAEQPGLYPLLLAVFDTLEAGAPAQVLRWFELQILSLAGYDLQLDACALCSARLPPAETLLAASAGGLVCAGCRAAAGAGRLLGVPAIKVLRFARGASLADFASLRVGDDLGQQLEGALGDVLRYHLERDLLTSRYLAAVTRLSREAPPTASPDVE
ncbi:MAG: DNA repair protein RecO [Dehalococcoidia bacterium]|nr:DNA repair protein RecO [Dehalococcoidia bacterium]